MADFLFSFFVIAAGSLGSFFFISRQPNEDRNILSLGFLAHLVSGVGQIFVYSVVYPGGDMTAYHYYGLPLANILRDDFSTFFPETLQAFFHLDYRLPYELMGEGTTGTMAIVSVWLMGLLGDSLWACVLGVAVVSYFAKIAVYQFVKQEFPRSEHRLTLIAMLLIPSAVFWTCALLKEPIVFCAFGPYFLGLRWLSQGRRHLPAIASMIFGSLFIWLIKPYVQVALVAASLAYFGWKWFAPSGGFVPRLRTIVIAPVVGLLALTAANNLLAIREGESVSSSLSYQRRVSSQAEGGSNFYLEDSSDDLGADSSAQQQLLLAPIALVTALYRPFVFEVKNAVQAINSLETLWLLVLSVQILRRLGVRASLYRVLASPTLVFCAVFTLILALGTGLATANFGTLSRYRAPMIPFFSLLLLALHSAGVRSPVGDHPVGQLGAAR
jgi:hypothetical protein